MAAVLRLLRSEALDALSRELGVEIHRQAERLRAGEHPFPQGKWR
jgi:hypothetical protein